MEGAVQVKRGRGGRPAAGQGDVETRLLDAATRLFLTRGYDGTSCDQVALDAQAGKASIYARYANKAALFAAVVDRMLARTAQDDVASGQPLTEKLAAAGMRIVEDALHADALALLRLLVAELPRLADTGVNPQQLFWQTGVRRVASAIGLADAVAEEFIALVLAPPLLRALLGDAVAPLLAAAPARIAAVIALLKADGKLD